MTLNVATAIEAGPIPLPALAVLAAAGGISLCLLGLRLLHQRHRHPELPSLQIGKATPGRVHLHGLAQGESTITSAITGQPCYYYRAIAWQQGAGHSRTWHKVAEEIELIPFWLDDMTGRIEVNAHGADLDLLRDFHEEYGPATLQTHTDLPQGVTAFLARHNVAIDRVVRIEEYRISPQSPLFVGGNLERREEIQPRKRPVSVAAMAGTREQPQIVYLSSAAPAEPATAMSMQSRLAAALNRAGAQNPAAWEVASPVATIRTDDHEQDAERASVLVIGKAKDSPLAISWRSRQRPPRGIAWPASAFGLGLLTLLASSYYLLASFRP